MYLVAAEQKTMGPDACRTMPVGGLAGLIVRGWRWLKERNLQQQRRLAKKQLFLIDSMVLGPKQRVVLMRCGTERFLVGLGAEGVTSVVRVEECAGAAKYLSLRAQTAHGHDVGRPHAGLLAGIRGSAALLGCQAGVCGTG